MKAIATKSSFLDVAGTLDPLLMSVLFMKAVLYGYNDKIVKSYIFQ